MPRKVDHDERRAFIVRGLVRLAAREGLHAVTMRSVAAETGVSLRLVQYYFDTKAGLMQAAIRQLERESNERWGASLDELEHPVSVRTFVEALVDESLPTDGESRAFHLVWMSYAVLAMTDEDLAAHPFIDGPDRLEQRLTEALTRAQSDGEFKAGLDPACEAARLLCLNHGLGTSVLVGQRSPADAQEILRYHLGGLFEPGD